MLTILKTKTETVNRGKTCDNLFVFEMGVIKVFGTAEFEENMSWNTGVHKRGIRNSSNCSTEGRNSSPLFLLENDERNTEFS